MPSASLSMLLYKVSVYVWLLLMSTIDCGTVFPGTLFLGNAFHPSADEDLPIDRQQHICF